MQGLTPLLNAPAHQFAAGQAPWAWPFGAGKVCCPSTKQMLSVAVSASQKALVHCCIVRIYCTVYWQGQEPNDRFLFDLATKRFVCVGQQPLPLNPPPIAPNLLPEVRDADFLPYLHYCADTYGYFERAVQEHHKFDGPGAHPSNSVILS